MPLTFTVTNVVDGDTIDVATSNGSAGLRVRMVGIDAPESGTCEADTDTRNLVELVTGQVVVLTTGGDGVDTERYGRYLRYVDVNGALRV